MRGVLLGGRTAPRPAGDFAYGLSVWLPVAIMVGVIVRESTEAFSGAHTSLWFRPIWQGIFGFVPDERWEEINHLLRKTGHFLGYGTLGLTWLRAWLITWMYSFRLRSATQWRRWAFVMAILCTTTIASMDELHQTFLPDRTGMMQDVVLDTCGAIVLCTTVALLFWLPVGRRNIAFATAK